MREFDLRARFCPLCDGHEHREVWSYAHAEPTRHEVFNWRVRNVVCETCGFGFVSPCPSQASLDAYYRDAFPLFGEGYFSVEARLTLLGPYVPARRHGAFLEIGGNAAGDFVVRLRSLFATLVNIEINEACASDESETGGLPAAGADIVAAYFVLEHVPDAIGFLSECRRLVRADGVVVVEVPNLHLYPRTAAGLDFHEHVNHFSPLSLEWIAARCGLRLIRISHEECSRPFGFAAVFRPGDRRDYDPAWSERENALACFAAGLKLVRAAQSTVQASRESLLRDLDQGRKVVMWGANALCRKVIGPTLPRGGLTIVDQNPEKRDYVAPNATREPAEALEAIRTADVVVICSALHERMIREHITGALGLDLSGKEVRVLPM